MHRNISIILRILIYQNLCTQFHFLVGWLALVTQDQRWKQIECSQNINR